MRAWIFILSCLYAVLLLSLIESEMKTRQLEQRINDLVKVCSGQ